MHKSNVRLDRKSLEVLYISFIRPILEYSIATAPTTRWNAKIKSKMPVTEQEISFLRKTFNRKTNGTQ